MAPKDVLVGVQLLFLILNSVVLGLRLFVRTKLNKAIGYDDYTMVTAFVSASVPSGQPSSVICSP